MKPRFTLRDLFWLVLVAGLALGWWREWSGNWHSLQSSRFTGHELDVAIEGRGYFSVATAETNDTLYTRHGQFSLDSTGRVCVERPDETWFLEPAINIPTDFETITISSEGQVLVRGNGIQCSVGQIQLTTFINADGLVEVSPGIYSPSDSSGTPCVTAPGEYGAGKLRQYRRELRP